MRNHKPRFSLGQTVATPGALQALDNAQETAMELIARHQSGDWGEVPPEDAATNEHSLEFGLRLLSAYILSNEEKVWIITEADRSVTTILLPSEY